MATAKDVGDNFYDLTRDDDDRATPKSPSGRCPPRGHVCVIDLVSDSEGADSDTENDARKKRPMQRNNNRDEFRSYPQNSSPLRRKKTSSPEGCGKRMHSNLPFQLPNTETEEQKTRRPVTVIDLPPKTTSDGATVTCGLLSLIHANADEHTLTGAGGSRELSRSQLLAPMHWPADLPFHHQPFHYCQHDNWSCGYRNLQMLISGLLPSLSAVFPEGVPGVEQIQRTIEKSWSRGFDRTSANHHQDALLGKKTWIGTVEVWSYLSFKGVDSFIVQFTKTKKDRALLGHFVWAYFSRILRVCGCCGRSSHDASASRHPLAVPTSLGSEYAARLLRETRGAARSTEDSMPRCTCSLPPLYLQWDGHSVTVVGIRKQEGAFGQAPSFNLIIFCPHKRKVPWLRDTLAAGVNIRKPALELPVRKLLQRDCQILLTTARTITGAESRLRKKCTKNVGFIDAVAEKL